MKQKILILAIAAITTVVSFGVTFFMFNLWFTLFGSGLISTILAILTLIGLAVSEASQVNWVQKKFAELQDKKLTPGKLPRDWPEVLLANLKKNVAADLTERQNLSIPDVRKKQQVYAKNFKRDLKADLKRS